MAGNTRERCKSGIRSRTQTGVYDCLCVRHSWKRISKIRTVWRHVLGGRVVTTPPATFKKLVENVLPVLKAKGEKPCIIIPPLPRYLFSRCCSDKGHCTNVTEPEFPAEMLSGFTKQRNELIRLLVQSGLKDFKVMDTCCTTSCIQTANTQTRLAELTKVLSDDGVHYNVIGRKNLAERTLKCLGSVLTTVKKPAKQTTFFWRGFRSLRGSVLPRAATGIACQPAGNQLRGTLRGRARGGASWPSCKGFPSIPKIVTKQ